MSLTKKLLGQTAVYGVLTIAARFINFLLVPIHTHYLSPEMYGRTGIFYGYISFVMILLSYGMETTFFNFARKKVQVSTVFGTSLSTLHFTSILFLIAAFIFKDTWAAAMDYAGFGNLVLYMAIILAFDAMSAIPLAYFRQQEKAWKFSIIRVSGILISILLNIYLIIICPKLIALGYTGWYASFYSSNALVDYIFIANLVSSIWVYLCCLPTLFKIKIKFDFTLLKEMLHYTWPLIFVGTAGIVNETFDRILLKELLPDGEYQAGIYNAFYKMSIVITLMIQAFRMGAEPFFFAQLNQQNKEQIYSMILKYFVHACVFVFLLTSLFAKPIAGIIIRNENYFEHPYALTIVPILLLANVFLGIHYNLSIWYKAENKTKYGAVIAIFGAAITLSINFIFIPQYGILASAMATLLCYFSMSILSYVWGQKHFYVPYPIKQIGLIILSGIMSLGLFTIIKQYINISYWLGIGLGFLILSLYLVLWFMKERKELLGLLKR